MSYLGFLLGPVYVGLLADATGLRGAMLAVAALAVALFVLTPALLRISGFWWTSQPTPHDHQPAPPRNSIEQPAHSIL